MHVFGLTKRTDLVLVVHASSTAGWAVAHLLLRRVAERLRDAADAPDRDRLPGEVADARRAPANHALGRRALCSGVSRDVVVFFKKKK